IHLLEKTIIIEDVSLVDFRGAQNAKIKIVSAAFPKSKIISRGDEIRIKGTEPEINRISEVIEMLLNQLNKYGKLNQDSIKRFLGSGADLSGAEVHDDEDVIVFGNKGIVVKAKSPNQKELVDTAKENDLVFAVGPAGTGKTYT